MKTYESKIYRKENPVRQVNEDSTQGNFVAPPSFSLNGHENTAGPIQARFGDENDIAQNDEPREAEDLDREDFHLQAEEDKNLEEAKTNLGDDFYDVIDALFELDYAGMERDVLYSEIKEMPLGLDISATTAMQSEIQNLLEFELENAKTPENIDPEYVHELCDAANDLRIVMNLENDLTRVTDEQYLLTHNEYIGLIRLLDQLPLNLAKSQKKQFENKLVLIKAHLAKAENEKDEAYLEMGINIGMDLVGALAFTNPWTALAYGVGSWALSTQYLDDKLGPQLDGSTKVSSDLGDDKQLGDAVVSGAKDIGKPAAQGGAKMSLYNKVGFGINRINDGLEIMTAYDNIDNLERERDDMEEKIDAQEKKIEYEEKMYKAKDKARDIRNTKKNNELQQQIWDLESSVKEAYSGFNKQFGETVGEI